MPESGTPAASTAYRYYVLAILVLVNTVNFIDRTAISILAPSIREEFQVSNTVTGLVMGIAFTFFYATLGFPIARLLDTKNRRNLLAGVLAIWSGMTALCGAAANIVQLFLFRVGVGIGEAGAGPASHSLIADYFAKLQRPTAIGFFSLGVPLGNFPRHPDRRSARGRFRLALDVFLARDAGHPGRVAHLAHGSRACAWRHGHR
jgi:MFS family permease